MALKPFIGISQIWYGDVFDAAVTAASLKTWLGTATEVKNSHQDTWQYTEDDPTYTDYINELNGEIYYRDVTQKGAKTIAFTMGEWSFDDKVALQGGKKVGTDDGWESSDTPSIVKTVEIIPTIVVEKIILSRTRLERELYHLYIFFIRLSYFHFKYLIGVRKVLYQNLNA